MEQRRAFTAVMAVLLFASTNRLVVVANFTFGECLPGKQSCRDCYLALKEELLSRDDNVYKLSKTFFPPDTNPPEFVKVTYIFTNNDVLINSSETWYWVEQSSYFLFPPNSFQFLSLFFGKPEQYYAQEVAVTLSATECLGVDEEHMTLLTQRVRNIVMLVRF